MNHQSSERIKLQKLRTLLIVSPNGIYEYNNNTPFLGSIENIRTQRDSSMERLFNQTRNIFFTISPKEENENAEIISNFERSKSSKKISSKSRSKKSSTYSVNNFFVDTFFDFDSETEKDNKQIVALEEKFYQHPVPISNLVFVKEIDKFSNEKFVSLQSIINFEDRQDLIEHQKLHKKYVCKYCGDFFESGPALGGHISKVHRGLSRTYKKNLIKREFKKTELERSKFIRDHLKGNKKISKRFFKD